MDADTISGLYRAVNFLRYETLKDPDVSLPPIECFSELFQYHDKNVLSPPDLSVSYAYYINLMLKGMYDNGDGLCALIDANLLGFFDYNARLSDTLFGYSCRGDEMNLSNLTILDTFLAFAVSRPIIPETMLDCKFCVFCLYESSHGLGDVEKRFKDMLCTHFTEKHELDYDPKEIDTAEVAAPVPITTVDVCKDSFLTDVMEGGDVKVLAELRERGDGSSGIGAFKNFVLIMATLKQEILTKKMEFSLQNHRRSLKSSQWTLHDFTAPRNVNVAAVEVLQSLRRGIGFRMERKKELVQCEKVHPVDFDRHLMGMKIKLNTAADQDRVKPASELFFKLSIPAVYKHSGKYNKVAHRIIWFKHLESLGYSCGQLCVLKEYFSKNANLKEYGGVPHGTFTPPIKYGTNRMWAQLILLYWVCVNLETFRALKNNTVEIFSADEPKTTPGDGLYIFGEEVGYRHYTGGRHYAAVYPWDRTLELLTEYDWLLQQQIIC
nr:hypothetical protein [Salmonid herpesvirus 1]